MSAMKALYLKFEEKVKVHFDDYNVKQLFY